MKENDELKKELFENYKETSNVNLERPTMP